MRNFYKEQSSNRYTVNGEVTDWVKVPFNEANYGTNYCGGIVCARTWLFVRDTAERVVRRADRRPARPCEINDDLAKFDIWDRYDYDGDGNFDEPDGYIDHFQSSTPAKARRPAAAHRAPTPSGAIAGTPTTPDIGA